jgi:hypothetical protein
MGKRSFKKAFKVQDEWVTPSILVNMLVPYLKKWESDFISKNGCKPILWLPFDTEESKYYTIFKKEGFQVVRSHLNDDKDFFNYQPAQFDIIVSNPPFSQKLKIMERIIFDLKKPFVLLMNMMAINYQNISNLFQFVNPKIQFIIPDKKVSFDGNTSSFCSGYVCYDFINHTEFVHLPHNNTKNNFSK